MKELFFILGFILIFFKGFLLAFGGLPAFFMSGCLSQSASSFYCAFLDEESFFLKTIEDIKEDLAKEGKSFIEVDLSAMEARIYQEGDLFKKFPILAKGDVSSWGGSAFGLYQVLGGNKFGYSGISEVYMPYALHYYGKYYIHGEPYYPNGDELISSVSGGCIRLSTKDAEEVYQLAEIGMPVLVLAAEKEGAAFIRENDFEIEGITAESYLAVDIDSGFVFAKKEPEKQLPCSSLTKLMAAVVVAENVDLEESITVDPEMLEAFGSTKGLKTGESFRPVELFYPLLMESSNDAAQALSGFLGKTRTVELMNEKAGSILMEDSRFVDSHGFSLENVSTAQDLFQLARYIFFARPPLLEITKGNEVRSFGGVSFDIEEMANENIFFKDPDFIGGKASYSSLSKNSGVFIFNILIGGEARNMAVVLLGSEDLKTDVQNIYRQVAENYLPVF